MSLSASQADALEQLWAVTASTTSAARERDERMLRENGWDVQRTADQIFTLQAGPSRSLSSQFEMERPAPRPRRRSSQPLPPGHANVGLGAGGAGGGGIWSLFGMVMSIVGGTWYFI
ncbi:hypothetical protein P7C73_g6732, partial [Tremellales sp. Uapishka_1]